MAESLPEWVISRTKHVALRGRQDPKQLTRFDRMMLIIAGLKNRGTQVGKDELEGFDYMDKASIQPVVEWVQAEQARSADDQDVVEATPALA